MNKELSFKKIPNKVKKCINAQYLWEEESLIASLVPVYHEVNNIQSLSLPSETMYQYTCTVGYLFKSFKYSFFAFVASSLPRELTPSGIKKHEGNIESFPE